MKTRTNELGSLLDRNDPAKILGDRYSVTIANNTNLMQDRDGVAMTLHGHRIATFRPDGSIEVSSCGWETVTTKQRLNAALQGTRWSVFAKNHVWHVWDRVADVKHLFRDGMVLHPGGEVS